MISNLLNLRELGFIEYAMALNFYAVIVDVFGAGTIKQFNRRTSIVNSNCCKLATNPLY